MLFRQLFDEESSTYTYLIADRSLKQALLVDPVLEQVERDLQLLDELELTLKYCLETHIHADNITGTGKLRAITGCLGIVPENAPVNCADGFLKHREVLQLGDVIIEEIATPGYTGSNAAYLVNQKAVLPGDALFIRGCGRTDFQSGDPGTLYDSVTQQLYTLPDETLVYIGHDYKGHSVSTIREEKQYNPRFFGRDRLQFITFMNNLNLPDPKKMSKAVPAHQKCGNIESVISDQ